MFNIILKDYFLLSSFNLFFFLPKIQLFLGLSTNVCIIIFFNSHHHVAAGSSVTVRKSFATRRDGNSQNHRYFYFFFLFLMTTINKKKKIVHFRWSVYNCHGGYNFRFLIVLKIYYEIIKVKRIFMIYVS